MHYIVFDLEFNQEIPSLQEKKKYPCPFEIIQIGAVKLDSRWKTVGTFNRLIKPTLFERVNPFITELTGITTENLQEESLFPDVYKDFLEFIESVESVFCVWGMTDMKELYRNAEYHGLDQSLLPKGYLNIQPYCTKHFHLPEKSLLKLENAVSLLNLPVDAHFHDALNDACYTAEIMKAIYEPSMLPKVYDPAYIPVRPPRQRKKVIDFEGLLHQFQKMYERELTQEEAGMIKTAYQMGKTKQFLKE